MGGRSEGMWLNWLEHRPVTPKVVGSSPIILAIPIYGSVAQLVEQEPFKFLVAGSNPVAPTISQFDFS